MVDLDVTAGIRPGYFGAVASDPVFVENRYVRRGDNRRWYPHHTLRELWLLSHAVDPVRLRMEVLNPARLPELYAAEPTRVERIAGRGSVAISNGVLCVDAVPPLDFTWVKW